MFPICRALLLDENTHRLAAEAGGTRDYEVALVNKDPAIVNCYIALLQERHLIFEKSDDCQQDYRTLIKLYAFSGEMQDPMFQDHVMEALRLRYRPNRGKDMPDDPNLENAILIYERTPPGSFLRQLIRDIYAILRLPKGVHTGQGGYPAELLDDLVTRIDLYNRNLEHWKELEAVLTTGWPWPYFHSKKWEDML